MKRLLLIISFSSLLCLVGYNSKGQGITDIVSIVGNSAKNYQVASDLYDLYVLFQDLYCNIDKFQDYNQHFALNSCVSRTSIVEFNFRISKVNVAIINLISNVIVSSSNEGAFSDFNGVAGATKEIRELFKDLRTVNKKAEAYVLSEIQDKYNSETYGFGTLNR